MNNFLRVRLFIFVTIALFLPILGFAKSSKVPHWVQKVTWKGKRAQIVRDELILKFKSHISENQIKGLLSKKKIKLKKYIKLIDVYLIELPPGHKLEGLAKELGNLPEVELAQPNFVNTSHQFPSPNDPYYQGTLTPRQFYLSQIQADLAWNDPNILTSKGIDTVSVAVLDSGVNYLHEDFFIDDFTSRILVAPPAFPAQAFLSGSIPGIAGVVVGRNCFAVEFGGNTFDPMDDDFSSVLGHGTHVAGIIGAATDNSYSNHVRKSRR